jgi:hypothetical protein
MRHYFLALVLVSSLSPAFAGTGLVDAPCKLIDREALVALKLGDHKTKETREKSTDATQASSPIVVGTCNFTSRAAPFSSLSVTTTMLPEGVKTAKPTCSDEPLTGGAGGPAGMEMAICNATVGNTFLTFILITNDASDTAMKSTFRSHIERLTDGLAKAGDGGIAAR